MSDAPRDPASSSTAPSKGSGVPSRFDPVYVNAMSHFYRGELGRMMAWRQRFDTTTTWAITTTTSIFTLSLSLKAVPHIIFFFNIVIVWIMLWIEARRYRFYDAFRARVRMLEAHFLVPMVAQNMKLLQGDWQKLICEDLLLPSFKVSTFEAVGRRLKRNYVYIFFIIILAWLTKIFLHADPAVSGWSTFKMALAVGNLPWWVSAVILFGTLLGVAGIHIWISHKTSGEISEFGAHRSLWRI
jgi:uncharacterized membrane protein